ncbi:MAG: VWA domain-containing protein [Fibrobacter sp.]|nr:VWA domain-containing protein [Fibrobacter sp.]
MSGETNIILTGETEHFYNYIIRRNALVKKELLKHAGWMQKVVLRLTAVAIIFICIGQSQAAEVCEATLDCPTNYATSSIDTLKLPPKIVALSNVFKHCSPTYFDESYVPGNVDTISLFFIIDHSGSMSEMDSTCTRYQLTANLIDSLKASSPVSEVGMVIFSNQLLHNAENDPYAVKLDPASSYTDAYIPLTQLNTTVGGQSASDYLKSVIALSSTERDIGFNRKLINSYYDNNGRHSGHAGFENSLTGYNGTTDITLAFDAARKAFQTAKNPRAKQYIIFLSDGEPQNVDLERKAFIDDYKSGTDLPATFTAFWVNKDQPIPDQIVEMTKNIQNNNYSASNKMSVVWKTQGNIEDLISKLLNVSTGRGFTKIPSIPQSMTINGISATKFDGDYAYFPNSFALKSPLTKFTVSFTYHYDSPMDIDSTKTFDILVKTDPNAKVPAEIATNCWEQGIIKFYVNNAEVPSMLTDDQKNIEIRYFPMTPMSQTSVQLKITNTAAGYKDSLTVTANKQSDYYTAIVTRETSNQSKVDNVLQTTVNDSVAAKYENPDFPLDIIRATRSIGAARNLGIVSASIFDQDADGFADLIKVTEATDQITSEELNQITPKLYFSGARSMKIVSASKTGAGFDLIVKVSDKEPNTATSADERLVIQNVPNLAAGGMFPAGSIVIADSMAPVIASANYLNGKSSGSVKDNDTLVVKFSEKADSVDVPAPFWLFDPVRQEKYSISLSTIASGDGITQRFIVTAVNVKTSVSRNDSIWINETASVNDMFNNVQNNQNNRRVTLQSQKIDYSFTVIAGPTPVNPKTYTIPNVIASQFNNGAVTSGVVIQIKSGEVVLPQDSISASITIYDQVGNAVVKDDKCAVTRENGKLLYIWNGVNRNGRYVGDGTYVAVITVTVSNGVSRTIKTKIGILYQ